MIHYQERNTAAIRVVLAAAPALCVAIERVSNATVLLQEAKEHLERICDKRADHPRAAFAWAPYVTEATITVRRRQLALKRAEFSLDVAALDNWHTLEGAVLGLREAELHHETAQIAIA